MLGFRLRENIFALAFSLKTNFSKVCLGFLDFLKPEAYILDPDISRFFFWQRLGPNPRHKTLHKRVSNNSQRFILGGLNEVFRVNFQIESDDVLSIW